MRDVCANTDNALTTIGRLPRCQRFITLPAWRTTWRVRATSCSYLFFILRRFTEARLLAARLISSSRYLTLRAGWTIFTCSALTLGGNTRQARVSTRMHPPSKLLSVGGNASIPIGRCLQVDDLLDKVLELRYLKSLQSLQSTLSRCRDDGSRAFRKKCCRRIAWLAPHASRTGTCLLRTHRGEPLCNCLKFGFLMASTTEIVMSHRTLTREAQRQLTTLQQPSVTPMSVVVCHWPSKSGPNLF